MHANLDGVVIIGFPRVIVDDGDKVVSDVPLLVVESGVVRGVGHDCAHVEHHLGGRAF